MLTIKYGYFDLVAKPDFREHQTVGLKYSFISNLITSHRITKHNLNVNGHFISRVYHVRVSATAPANRQFPPFSAGVP